MNVTESLRQQFKRIQLFSLVAGIAGLLLCGYGASISTAQFFQSYLFGYLFWIGIALGSLALVALHHLVGGGWGFTIQRVLEAITKTLPLMIVFFIPFFFGMKELYLWARPEAVAADEILQHKALYLNTTFFWIRAAAYFAIWTVFIFLMNKWSREQDRTGEPATTRRMQMLGGPALLVYVLTVTFASVDWVMSLDPHWFSTIYGIIFAVAQGLASLAFSIIIVAALASQKPLSEHVTSKQFHDLGTLLLAFVMLWAYVAFSQFLIIWSGNLPEEIPWYIQRTHGGWGVIGALLVILHFALPFVLLLMRSVKRRANVLIKVAVLIVIMRLVDLFWIVAPNFHPESFSIHWLDIAAPLGIGGIWIAVFLRQLQALPLLPMNDPRFHEAFHHE
jgi:hypothetical protein